MLNVIGPGKLIILQKPLSRTEIEIPGTCHLRDYQVRPLPKCTGEHVTSEILKYSPFQTALIMKPGLLMADSQWPTASPQPT